MSRKVIISLTGSTYNYDDYTTKLLEEKDIHLLFAQRYQWIDTEYRIDELPLPTEVGVSCFFTTTYIRSQSL